ncbi:hypothetical protein L0Y69_02545 [bacterium]|nr:hypothetical protein [bacterium]
MRMLFARFTDNTIIVLDRTVASHCTVLILWDILNFEREPSSLRPRLEEVLFELLLENRDRTLRHLCKNIHIAIRVRDACARAGGWSEVFNRPTSPDGFYSCGTRALSCFGISPLVGYS